MKAVTERARHLVLRLEGVALPDALLGALRDEVVTAGWLRGSGVLDDVEIRTASGRPRALSGAVHAVMLEGSVGLARGDVSCGLRAVLARETDTGIETVAGEIVRARARFVEVVVSAFDDLAATRVTDEATGVTTLAPDPSTVRAPSPVAAPAPAEARPAPVEAAPRPAPPQAAASSPQLQPSQLPPKPVRPKSNDEEVAYPDAGDVVEHFHFGTCEVVKSDGDRLHLRDPREGRIKEIALEKLKVTPLPSDEGAPRRFKLDRKL